VTVDAGGRVDASEAVDDFCWGYVADGPDYSVEYSAGEFSLYFSATSDADTTMVVRDPGGEWHCNDDGLGWGLNPQIVFDQPASGRYDIWVGTYGERSDYPEATLAVSEIGATGGSGNIDWNGEPSYGDVALDAGFSPDPYVVSLSAGGSEYAGSLGPGCVGYVAGSPDFNLNYTSGDWSLFISASSSTDTTLVVNAPDGQWYCNDDSRGLNPAVEFSNPESGLYNIWVGTYGDSGELPPATLFISEMESQF
jgi:hypothetical protein